MFSGRVLLCIFGSAIVKKQGLSTIGYLKTNAFHLLNGERGKMGHNTSDHYFYDPSKKLKVYDLSNYPNINLGQYSQRTPGRCAASLLGQTSLKPAKSRAIVAGSPIPTAEVPVHQPTKGL
jgi:hypothetical protein